MEDKNIELLEEIKRMEEETRDKKYYLENLNLPEKISAFNQKMFESGKNLQKWFYDSRKSILGLYKETKERKKDNKILVEDTNFIIQNYIDYYDGLKSFIKDIQKRFTKANEIEDKEKILNVLFNMIEKDFTFIEEYLEKKEETLNDALRNIECGIDIIRLTDQFKKDYDILFSKRLADYEIYSVLCLLFISSTMNFVTNIENRPMRTYHMIKDALSDTTFDKEKYEVCDKYKLF